MSEMVLEPSSAVCERSICERVWLTEGKSLHCTTFKSGVLRSICCYITCALDAGMRSKSYFQKFECNYDSEFVCVRRE